MAPSDEPFDRDYMRGTSEEDTGSFIRPETQLESEFEEAERLGWIHDARNLLNSMIISLVYLRLNFKDITEDLHFQSLLSSSEILSDLLRRILKKLLKCGNSITREQQKKEEKTLNLPELLEKVWSSIAPSLKMKNLHGSFKILERTPLHWEVSEANIREILLNLIGNSIKFTEKGAITVKVRFEEDIEEIVDERSEEDTWSDFED